MIEDQSDDEDATEAVVEALEDSIESAKQSGAIGVGIVLLFDSGAAQFYAGDEGEIADLLRGFARLLKRRADRDDDHGMLILNGAN